MKTGSYDPETHDLLLTAVPAPDARAHEDWTDVLERAGVQRRPLRRRRWLLALAAGGLLLAAGAAVGAIRGVPWWDSAEPPVNPKVVDWQLAPHAGWSSFPPTADRSRARTVAKEDGAALVAAPVGKGGYCVIPSLPGSPSLGVSCVYQPDDEFRSYARPSSDLPPRWIVFGRIIDPEAATLDLSEAAGIAFEVPLQPGGFFIASIPESRWDELSEQAGKGEVLDGSGATLRTGCVNWGPSPGTEGAGLSRYGFWSEGPGPCRPRPEPLLPRIDLDRAKELVSLTLTSNFSIWKKGATVALWTAPTLDGLECVYVALASPRPSGVSSHTPGGGTCGEPARQRPPSGSPFGSTQLSVDSGGGLFSGEVEPASGIVRVVLRSGRGSTQLPFRNSHFLGQLPEGGSPAKLPPGGPFVVVGYDRAGSEVGSIDLQKLQQPAPD